MKMSDGDFERLAAFTDEYRKIRKYFSKDFYSLGADIYDTTSWTIWQYHDKESGSGIVMAFRRSDSPFDNVTVELNGLSDGQEYSYHNFDTSETFVSNNKISIKLSEKRSSVIIEYSHNLF